MENKIDLRNKYVLRVLDKVNSLEKMTNTLSQVDSALFSQYGGAAPGGAAPGSAAPQATISQVQEALNTKATEVGDLNDQIKEQITQVKTSLGALLTAVQGVKVPADAVGKVADEIKGTAPAPAPASASGPGRSTSPVRSRP